jgi:hypothetical protein
MQYIVVTVAVLTMFRSFLLPARVEAKLFAGLNCSSIYWPLAPYFLVTLFLCSLEGLSISLDFSLFLLYLLVLGIISIPTGFAFFALIDFIFDRFSVAAPPLIPKKQQDSPDQTFMTRIGNAAQQIFYSAARLWVYAFPVIFVFFCYSHLKALIPVLSLTQPLDQFFWNLDNLICPGVTPLVLPEFPGKSMFTEILELAYHFLSFTYPLALGGLFFNKQHKILKSVIFALIICFALANFLYFALPCDGPVFFKPESYSIPEGGSVDITQKWLLEERSAFLSSIGDYKVKIFNGIAGFPSMHMAQTLILLWGTFLGLKRLFPFFVFYEILLFLSTLVFGWHYLVDDIAGIIFAVISIKISCWYYQRFPESSENTNRV